MRLNKWFLSFLVLATTSQTMAMPFGLSPIRLPGETYEMAVSRTHEDYVSRREDRTNAENSQVPMKDLDLTVIPELPSVEVLLEQFAYIRDTKFIESRSLKFPRRISWLYPDDGCYVRAEIAANALEKHGAPQPMKLFVFGNLQASTPNSILGYVQWWYHVAVTYRVGSAVYIFDPAINPRAPLTLQEWNDAVGGQLTHVKYSLCSGESFDPTSTCKNAKPHPETSTRQEQIGFLSSEWERLLELHRNPYDELGDNPPWKANP